MDDRIRRILAAVDRVPGFDVDRAAVARRAMDAKTKPRGSLGRLEELAVTVAGIRGQERPAPSTSVVVVAAADHGVAADGVSAYPQEVTRQMVANFAAGGAAVCVLARRAGAELVVIDAGIAATDQAIPGVLDRRVGAGTANLARGPAMTMRQAVDSLDAGIEIAERLAEGSAGLVGVGEMGIGNTTAASALAAAMLPAHPVAVCGRGTGLDDDGLARKIEAVTRGLEVNRDAVSSGDPIEILAAVGGFEIGVVSGVIVGCASARIPVVLDGFITAAAALVACRLAPRCREMVIASHLSAEPGHTLILDALGLEPLLDLGMRLGEGSAAALAIPIIDAALDLLGSMATFDAAGVSDAGA